jgi:hypothetical protein
MAEVFGAVLGSVLAAITFYLGLALARADAGTRAAVDRDRELTRTLVHVGPSIDFEAEVRRSTADIAAESAAARREGQRPAVVAGLLLVIAVVAQTWAAVSAEVTATEAGVLGLITAAIVVVFFGGTLQLRRSDQTVQALIARAPNVGADRLERSIAATHMMCTAVQLARSGRIEYRAQWQVMRSELEENVRWQKEIADTAAGSLKVEAAAVYAQSRDALDEVESLIESAGDDGDLQASSNAVRSALAEVRQQLGRLKDDTRLRSWPRLRGLEAQVELAHDLVDPDVTWMAPVSRNRLATALPMLHDAAQRTGDTRWLLAEAFAVEEAERSTSPAVETQADAIDLLRRAAIRDLVAAPDPAAAHQPLRPRHPGTYIAALTATPPLLGSQAAWLGTQCLIACAGPRGSSDEDLSAELTEVLNAAAAAEPEALFLHLHLGEWARTLQFLQGEVAASVGQRLNHLWDVDVRPRLVPQLAGPPDLPTYAASKEWAEGLAAGLGPPWQAGPVDDSAS